MRIDEKNGNHLIAEDGKVLRRISDGSIAGREIWLGYTYYLNGEELSTPFEELPEHYEEVDAPEEVVEAVRGGCYLRAEGHHRGGCGEDAGGDRTVEGSD